MERSLEILERVKAEAAEEKTGEEYGWIFGSNSRLPEVSLKEANEQSKARKEAFDAKAAASQAREGEALSQTTIDGIWQEMPDDGFCDGGVLVRIEKQGE